MLLLYSKFGILVLFPFDIQHLYSLIQAFFWLFHFHGVGLLEKKTKTKFVFNV